MNSQDADAGDLVHAPSDAAAINSSLGALRNAIAELLDVARTLSPAQELSATARLVEARARELAQRLEQRTELSFSLRGPHPAPMDKFRLLLVEDDPEHCQLLEDGLSPWFEVRAVQTGNAAAELLKKELPDVVLTDLCLPTTSGLELIELVRAAGDLSHVPVVVLSARADTSTKVHAFESGAFDFIAKPYDVAEVVARLRNALAHAQQLRRERLLGGRDDLTGLANRRAFRTCLEGAVRAARLSETPMALVLIDQDRLKYINDTFGHAAGDDALRILSDALVASSRGSDCAARVGGDEFALVVPRCDREGARTLLYRVEEALRRKPLTVGPGTGIVISASWGIACFGEAGENETVEQLLRRADDELYAHKRRQSGAA